LRFRSLVLALSLTACSGGGGSSSSTPAPPPPPPPPPPANTAPSVNVMAPSSIDERQSFTIDASGSTDADGDTLSFQISLSGSSNAFLVGSADGPEWTIETNEVASDETIEATITVSDGTDSTSQTVSITITDFDRTPLSSQWGASADQLTITNPPFSNLAPGFPKSTQLPLLSFFTRQNDGTLELQTFNFTNAEFPTSVITSLPGGPSGAFQSTRNELTSSPSDEFVLWSGDEGIVQIYKSETDGTYSDGGSFSIPEVCNAISAFVGDDRGPAFGIEEYPGLIVGTPNGLTALFNNGNPREDFTMNPGFVPSDMEIAARGTFTNSRIIATTGDFCGLDSGTFTQNGANAPGNYSETRSELTLITDTTGNSVTLGNSISVSLPAISNLRLIAEAGGVNQDGSTFAALLFSDGEHEGTHQVTIVHQDPAGTFSQTDIALPNGVPLDMAVTSIDVRADGNQNPGMSDFDSDIVIAVPETPYAYVLKNTSSPTVSLSFAPIEYAEVGFGVNQIALIDGDGSLGPELVTGDGTTLDLYVNTEQ